MLRNLLASLIVFLCVGSVAHAIKITDSANPHNLSVNSLGSVKATAASMDQICVFCHTPHSAAPKSPLWNRPDPLGPNNDGTFPLYNSPTLRIDDASAVGLTGYENSSTDSDGVTLYPNGASRLCLSCHDGVTSVGVLLGNQTIAMTSDFASAVDLATSHPVSFSYSQAVIDGLSLTGYTMPIGSFTPLTGGKMQCTTCHDPHESTSSLPAYGGLPFWRHQGTTIAASYDDVCDSCHTGVPSTGIHPIP